MKPGFCLSGPNWTWRRNQREVDAPTYVQERTTTSEPAEVSRTGNYNRSFKRPAQMLTLEVGVTRNEYADIMSRTMTMPIYFLKKNPKRRRELEKALEQICLRTAPSGQQEIFCF